MNDERCVSRSAWHARPVLPVVGLRLLEGRVGSTLLMQLLATSPEIVLDRRYPQGEYRYLSYCARAASFMVRSPHPGEDPGLNELFFGPDGRFGPLPFDPESLDRADLEPALLAGLWSAFSAGFVARQPNARWYAEKLAVGVQPLVDAGIPLRVIDCLRDPRDVLTSIRAFTASIGVTAFGQHAGDTEGEYLERFIGAITDQLDQMAATPPAVDRITVRYEDFARDPTGLAHRLEQWLGVALDPAVIERTRDAMAHHRTTASVDASINRWARELPPLQAEQIWDAVGGRLAAYGYTARPL